MAEDQRALTVVAESDETLIASGSFPEPYIDVEAKEHLKFFSTDFCLFRLLCRSSDVGEEEAAACVRAAWNGGGG